MKNDLIKIIAGPCSIDDKNIKEVYELAEMKIKNRAGKIQRAIYGTRIVGLKSRTELNNDGKGMGIDFSTFQKNLQILANGGSLRDLEVLPSAYLAETVVKKTQLLIATEIMLPLIQLASYAGRIPAGKLMPWNPAVDQLGWTILEIAEFAKRHHWHIGIKNGKWVGDHLHLANSENYSGKTTLEKTWCGLTSYAQGIQGEIILIHRGVDVPDKGDYRNAIVHEIAKRTKIATGVKLFFDPSHSHGPKMRHHILSSVIEAMKIKLNQDEYLYDGILIEAGTSQTDTDQHVTLAELHTLIQILATFRDIAEPEPITKQNLNQLKGKKTDNNRSTTYRYVQ